MPPKAYSPTLNKGFFFVSKTSGPFLAGVTFPNSLMHTPLCLVVTKVHNKLILISMVRRRHRSRKGVIFFWFLNQEIRL